MRYTISIVLILSSLYSYSQLYIASDTVFTLIGLETQLSSNESINIINTHIKGTGVFNLLGSSVQHLESSKGSLELPNLTIKYASLLDLNTALSINNKLVIENGKLYLSHNLTLSRPSALVLKGYSEVIETSNGTLMFMKNVKERLLINAIATSVFYVSPKNSHNAQTFIIVKLPFIKRPLQYISDYMVSIKVTTPPPKLAYS